MKHFFKLFTGIGAVLLSLGIMSVTAFASELPQKQIIVNGNGDIQAQPDMATIYLGATTTAATAAEAQSNCNNIMNNVTERLLGLGIVKEDILTGSYNVYPRYNYNDATGERAISGYQANYSIQVKTKDIDNVGILISAATEAGANSNDGVEFSIADPAPYYEQALKQAVKNANISANAIAQSLGVPLGAAIQVEENSGGYSYNSFKSAGGSNMAATEAAMDAGSSADITYDKITISARIRVTYTY